MTGSTPPPWHRQPEEGEGAYAAFLAYRDLGPGRSIERVREGFGEGTAKSTRLYERWSGLHGWVARCRAWDAHLQAERDKVAAAEARKWERRRQGHLESARQDAQRLREKAGRMLAWPIQGTDASADGQAIIVRPVGWTFGTAAQLLRFAAEMEAAVLRAVGQDVAELSEAETRGTAEG